MDRQTHPNSQDDTSPCSNPLHKNFHWNSSKVILTHFEWNPNWVLVQNLESSELEHLDQLRYSVTFQKQYLSPLNSAHRGTGLQQKCF